MRGCSSRESFCASLFLLCWSRSLLHHDVERVTGPHDNLVRAQPLTLTYVRVGDVGDARVFQLKALLPALRRLGVLLAGILRWFVSRTRSSEHRASRGNPRRSEVCAFPRSPSPGSSVVEHVRPVLPALARSVVRGHPGAPCSGSDNGSTRSLMTIEAVDRHHPTAPRADSSDGRAAEMMTRKVGSSTLPRRTTATKETGDGAVLHRRASGSRSR